MPARLPAGERFAQVPDRLVRQCGAEAGVVWGWLRARADAEGWTRATLAETARGTGLAPRTCRRRIEGLAETGWLERRRTGRASLWRARMATVANQSGHSGQSEWPNSTYQSGHRGHSQADPPLQPPCSGELLRGGEERGERTTTAPPPAARAEPEKTDAAPGGTTMHHENQRAADRPRGWIEDRHGPAATLPFADDRQGDTPSLEAPATGHGAACAAGQAARPRDPSPALSGLEDLVRRIRRKQETPERPEAILAILVEDLRMRPPPYSRADLDLFVEVMPRIDARAYRFRKIVGPIAAGVRQERLAARCRAIEEGRLWRAWLRSDPGRTARVDHVDVPGGRVTIVEWEEGGRGDRRVLATLAEVEAWGFAPEGPTLFPLGDRPAPPAALRASASAAARSTERFLAVLPDDPACRAAAERVLAAVGPERWRTWLAPGRIRWHADAEGRVRIEAANLFVGDYVGRHFAEALAKAGVAVARGSAIA